MPTSKVTIAWRRSLRGLSGDPANTGHNLRPAAIPAFRHTSPIGVPVSACCKIKAICASLNFERFMEIPFLSQAAKVENSNPIRSSFWEADHICASRS
jgi:hypothetical protein